MTRVLCAAALAMCMTVLFSNVNSLAGQKGNHRGREALGDYYRKHGGQAGDLKSNFGNGDMRKKQGNGQTNQNDRLPFGDYFRENGGQTKEPYKEKPDQNRGNTKERDWKQGDGQAGKHYGGYMSRMTASERKKMIDKLRSRKKDPKSWSIDDAEAALKSGGIRKDEIEKLTPSVINNMVMMGAFKNDVGRMPAEVVKTICATLKKLLANNDWSNLRPEKAEYIAGILPKCTGAFDKMPAAVAEAAATKIGIQGQRMSPADQKKLRLKLGSARSWNKDKARKLFGFIKNSPKDMNDLPDESVLGLLDDSSLVSQMKRRESRNLKDRLLRTRDYNDPRVLTAEKLKKLPPSTMSVLSPSYLKRLNCDAIKDSLSQLKHCRFRTKYQRQVVYKRCQSALGMDDFGTMDAAKLETIGSGLDGFKQRELKKLRPSAVEGALSILATQKWSKIACRELVIKLKENNNGSITSKCGQLKSLACCLTTTEIASCNPSDMGLDDNTTTVDLNGMEKRQVMKLGKKFIQEKGGFAKSDFTVSDFKRLAKVFVKAMSKSDVDSMKTDADTGDKLEALTDEEDDMDSPLLNKLGEKVKAFIEFLGKNKMNSETAEKIARALKYFKKFNDEFEDLTPDNNTRRSIMTSLGSSSTRVKSRQEKQELFKKCLKYRPDPTNPIKTKDKSSGVKLDSSDLQDCGNLISGMQDEDIQQLDDVTLTSGDNARRMCMTLEHSVKKTLMARMRKISNALTDSVTASQLGACSGQMTQVDIDRVPDSVAQEECSVWLEDGDEEDAHVTALAQNGFPQPQTEQDERQAGRMRMAQKCLVANQAVNTPASRRRKRTTTTITCDDLTRLGSLAVGVTAEQIRTLSDVEFEACIEDMNALSGWDNLQREAFTSKAKQAWGSAVGSWDTDRVSLGGSIVASGLSDGEIATLQLDSIDAAAAVGQSNYFTASQLSTLFNRFLAANGIQSSELTEDQLSGFGHLACGASNTQISRIQNDAYKDAAGSIGALTSCENAQMMAYAAQAKTAYGPVSSWDTTAVTTIGTMVGGLGNEISQLNSDNIGALTPTVIAVIPPSTFSKLRASQLSGFSSAQANAVTQSQQSALSSEQMATLASAGAENKPKTRDSGTSRTAEASVCLLASVTLILSKL